MPLREGFTRTFYRPAANRLKYALKSARPVLVSLATRNHLGNAVMPARADESTVGSRLRGNDCVRGVRSEGNRSSAKQSHHVYENK